MNKHTLHLYTNRSSLKQKSDLFYVDVLWRVDFNRDLDHFFNKRKYMHNFELLKTGIGKLSITFKFDTSFSEDANLSYVEALAAKHVISNSGLNAFGFTDDKVSIRRDQLHIVFSSPTAAMLIGRNQAPKNFLNEFGAISSRTSPCAGYLFGASVEIKQDPLWALEQLNNNADFAYYNNAADIDIRQNDYVFNAQGEMIIDYRTVSEFLESDWTQFLMQVKRVEYPRPFEAIHEIVKTADRIIYTDNGYLTKIRNLFGDDCLILHNSELCVYMPIKPIAKMQYLVLGYRRYIGPLKLKEMHENGFALHQKQLLSDEELSQLEQE